LLTIGISMNTLSTARMIVSSESTNPKFTAQSPRAAMKRPKPC
jgi:hypothetical protein